MTVAEARYVEALARSAAGALYKRNRGRGFDYDALYSGALRGVYAGLAKVDAARATAATFLLSCAWRQGNAEARGRLHRLSNLELLDELHPCPRSGEPADGLTPGDVARVFGIDPRDAEVLHRMAAGETAADVAREWGVSRKEVWRRSLRARARIRAGMTRDEAARRLGVC